jgi:hypothetical protein
VPGENADSKEAVVPSSAPSPSSKKTITCVSGKYKVSVSNKNPKCPPGFKKK